MLLHTGNEDAVNPGSQQPNWIQHLLRDDSVRILTADRMMFGAILCCLAYALFFLSGLHTTIG